jgi:hypothetical protein
MDSDVMHDPLLEGHVRVEQLRELTWNNDFVLSGGYNWDTSAPSDQPHPNRRGERLNFWLVPTVLATADDVRGTHELLRDSDKLNTKWANILTLVNNVEHNWRGFLASKNAALVYWPEPNTYMTANRRAAGAERILSDTDRLRGSQQRESVFYLRDRASEGRLVGQHNKEIFTTKPVKTYFNWLRDMLVARVAPSVEQVCVVVESIRRPCLRAGQPHHYFGRPTAASPTSPSSQTAESTI